MPKHKAGRDTRLAVLLFLAVAAFPSLSLAQPAPVDRVTAEEQQLADLVNRYRVENGLPAVPLSLNLMKVAHWHVWDLQHQNPTTETCNLHSWSSARTYSAGVPDTWSPVCYLADHSQSQGMWDKPREISAGAFGGNGYENAHFNSAGAMPNSALSGWTNSPGHNEVMLNRGIWESLPWNSMGVAILGNYAVLWFSDTVDAAAPMRLASR